MDRFSFIALDLSLQALIAYKALYKKFRDGGETIIFKANDFADPQHSEIFRLLFAEPKLKDHARNFAAICEADIDDVPTLADFLAGKNTPARRAGRELVAKTSPGAPGYIAAFPVVDALDFGAASQHVGDRVELIGKIVEVKPGVGRRGRGKGRPYIFINFGDWHVNIIKISIWSEGLEKLKEKPSKSWVGRWVSITGLIDPPFTSHRYGYTHLSITVQEDGQIQWIDEAQAKFRLGSVGKAQPPRNRQIIERVLGSAKATVATASKPTSGVGISSGVGARGSVSSNQTIVQQIKLATGQTGSLGTSTSYTGSRAPAQQTSANKPLLKVPTWAWAAGGIAALFLLLHSLGGSKSPPPQPTRLPQEPPVSRPSPPASVESIPRWQQPKAPEIPPSWRKSELPAEPPPGKDPTTANLEKSKRPPNEIPPALPAPIEILPSSPKAQVEPPPTTKPSSTPQLDLGNTEDAKRVQRRLIDLGFLFGSADGIWGPASRRALEDFRVAQKIDQGGAWDETTQQLLFGDSAVHAPVPSSKPDSYVGGWGTDLADCRQSQGGRGHLTITSRRAEAFGTVCEFQSVQQEVPNVWRLQAKCASSTERWIANIRFTILGNKLTWSSERGTASYVRCSG